MEQIKDGLRKFWGKVVEHKDVVIPTTTAIVGALIGAGVTVVIMNNTGMQPTITMEDIVDAVEQNK